MKGRWTVCLISQMMQNKRFPLCCNVVATRSWRLSSCGYGVSLQSATGALLWTGFYFINSHEIFPAHNDPIVLDSIPYRWGFSINWKTNAVKWNAFGFIYCKYFVSVCNSVLKWQYNQLVSHTVHTGILRGLCSVFGLCWSTLFKYIQMEKVFCSKRAHFFFYRDFFVSCFFFFNNNILWVWKIEKLIEMCV